MSVEQDLLFGGGDQIDAVITELAKSSHWTPDPKMDRQFVGDLMERYPTVNLKAEAFKWRTWMTEHTQKKEVKPRARFARWVDSAATKRLTARAVRKDRGIPKSITAPASREAFGTESSQGLTGW